MPTPFTQYFFAYGTLKDAKTRDKVLGRHVEGISAMLPGHKKVYDGSFPYLIKSTTLGPSGVAGLLFQLTDSDMAKLDAWENKYKRIKVRLSNGIQAWCYEETKHSDQA